MELRTYRAKSMQQALALVRQDLGPAAAVLHTRDVRAGGLLSFLPGMRRIEVTASNQIAVPSKLPSKLSSRLPIHSQGIDLSRPDEVAAALGPDVLRTNGLLRLRDADFSNRGRDAHDDRSSTASLHSMVDDLCQRTRKSPAHDMPESLFHLFTDLIEADVNDDLARELVDRVRREMSPRDLSDPVLVKNHLMRMIADEIDTTGPIRVTPGTRRIVALVGPTGVGKTTTIAKLAANYRLKEKRRVGLITVDTYRIAAVEQLRTYADIIDLPMSVVSTPREMREAIARMSDLDLVLMDTAGRSPRDEVRIQELKTMLIEAQADEVHLVLSSVGSAMSLTKTAQQFATVGVTAVLLTKLDESSGLGNLLPLLRSSKLPLSYVTNGQNVPDDIAAADRRKLAQAVLGG